MREREVQAAAPPPMAGQPPPNLGWRGTKLGIGEGGGVYAKKKVKRGEQLGLT
jgi:hypothetical protein